MSNIDLGEASTLLQAITGIQAPWLAALWPDLDVLFRIDDRRRQVWFAVGAQMALRPEMVALGIHPTELPAWLESAHPKDILNAAGLGTPDGWRRALGKLGPIAMREPTAYLRLFNVLSDGGAGAKVLHHAHALTQPLIDVLAAIEPSLRHRQLVMRFLDVRSSAPAPRAREWSWRLRRLRVIDPGMAEDIEARVRQGGAPIDLTADMQVAPDLAFPKPPWLGTPRMHSVRTPSDLISLGHRFANCLSTRVPSARAGKSFYYEWVGQPGMVVEIAPDEPYGFSVENVGLVRNAAPSEADLRAVAAELASEEHIFCDIEQLRARM